MSLGERIKKLRNEKNLSQEKFGKQTGIHPNHVGKYEANKTVPSADKLRKIVVISENDKPLAKIVPVSDQGTKRTAGLNKGKIWVSDDFDDSLPDDFWMGSL